MHYLILLLFMVSCGVNKETKYFKVVRHDPLVNFGNNKDIQYFNINANDDTLSSTYPVEVNKKYTEIEQLDMIRELLTMESDERICSYPVMNWNTFLSQLYSDTLKQYSIQVEALFLINQVYFDNPFSYSPLPVLTNTENTQNETISGSIIQQAYRDYKDWYIQLKRIGLKEARVQGVKPLQNSNVKWLYGN